MSRPATPAPAPAGGSAVWWILRVALSAATALLLVGDGAQALGGKPEVVAHAAPLALAALAWSARGGARRAAGHRVEASSVTA